MLKLANLSSKFKKFRYILIILFSSQKLKQTSTKQLSFNKIISQAKN